MMFPSPCNIPINYGSGLRKIPLMNFLKDIRIVTGFMTRLPVTWPQNSTMADLAGAMWAMPVVGVIVGMITGLALWLGGLFPWPVVVTVIIAVMVQILVTGALHEDGLADVADGFGGGVTARQKRDIMADSRIGSYGVLALIISVTLKIVLLGTPPTWADTFFIWTAAMVLSRGVLPVVMIMFSAAKTDGLGANAGKPSATCAGTALLLAFIIAGILIPWLAAITAVIMVFMTAFLLASLAKFQIGGYTGDVLGTIVGASEIVALMTGVIWI